MGENGYVYGVYESIVTNTQSELILFFVLLAAVSVPLYIAVSRAKKQERQCQREKEAQYMDVLRSNTQAITELTAVTKGHVAQSQTALARIHDRIDTKLAKRKQAEITAKEGGGNDD